MRLFIRNSYPLSASFFDVSLSASNSLILFCNISGLLGGIRIPVSLFVINSGIDFGMESDQHSGMDSRMYSGMGSDMVLVWILSRILACIRAWILAMAWALARILK